MELFDQRFVRFMWDDELVGKDCFVADNIEDLTFAVRNDGKCGVRTNALRPSSRASLPFLDSVCNNCYPFAYYDPNYRVKWAYYKEGKKVQVKKTDSFADWVDCNGPLWSEDCSYRVKPDEEKWIAYLSRGGMKPYLTACREDGWESVQKKYNAKTKLFIGTESEVEGWYESRQKFAQVIKAWEDGKTIQVYETLYKKWSDCAGTLEWYTDCEYRIKQECPCEEGIDSKACAGCEHSEDGKPEREPYESVEEFIQDYQKRFPTAIPRPARAMPLIWLANAPSKEIHLVTGFNMTDEYESEKGVCVRDVIWSFGELFNSWTFLDGSPCGKAAKE